MVPIRENNSRTHNKYILFVNFYENIRGKEYVFHRTICMTKGRKKRVILFQIENISAPNSLYE